MDSSEMSLSTNVVNLATRVATEVKAVRTLINGNTADLSALTTTAKGNLVASLNELKSGLTSLSTELTGYKTSNDADISTIEGNITTINGTLNAIQSAIDSLDVSAQVLALIDDATISTTKVWSSSKVNTEIADAINDVVGLAPGALDTLNELAAALGDDANFAGTITGLISGKSDLGHTHPISQVVDLQDALDSKASNTALTALATAVGDTNTNYATTFEAGLA